MASDHVVSVILGYGYPLGSTISLIGRDCSNDLTWLKGKPEIGDKIIIKVIESDDIVDDLFNKIREELIQEIQRKNNDPRAAIDILMAAKYFERIGDHAVNVAEWVQYSITGVHKSNEHHIEDR